MKVSAAILKWLLRFYPPLFFQRIWVVSLSKAFTSVRVKISKSLLNQNYNSSIFGGTIYAATDAFYPVLFHQALIRKDFKIIVWLKSASIQYLKPGRSALYFEINLPDTELNKAKHILITEGKFIHTYPIELYDTKGELCATVSSEIYIRNLEFIKHESDT